MSFAVKIELSVVLAAASFPACGGGNYSVFAAD